MRVSGRGRIVTGIASGSSRKAERHLAVPSDASMITNPAVADRVPGPALPQGLPPGPLAAAISALARAAYIVPGGGCRSK
ncbi:hypothetical protein GCM10027359_00360 [Marilutibacter aestuarii]